MSVKLQTTAAVSKGLRKQRAVAKVNHSRAQKSRQLITTFPDYPLISSTPLRYNVQLNQQLTSVQQVYDYLIKLKSQLFHLYSIIDQEKDLNLIQQQANTLFSLLLQRTTLSAGTVDRQLKVVLAGSAKVNFFSDEFDELLQQSAGETLLFSLAGQKEEMIGLKLLEKSLPKQRLLQLNKGLGLLGIHGRYNDRGQVVFTINESRWSRLNSHLKVKGEGHCYPQNEFVLVQLRPESALEQQIQHIISDPSGAKSYLDQIKASLHQITQQLHWLAIHKKNVGNRIKAMSTFPEAGTAILASHALFQQLSDDNISYSTLSQAISGQGNVRTATVKNLLLGYA